jgi:glutathione S-transferase
MCGRFARTSSPPNIEFTFRTTNPLSDMQPHCESERESDQPWTIERLQRFKIQLDRGILEEGEPMYRLISATPSPYARKVRIQLAEKGIPFELVTEVPWNRDTITPQFNPLEKLPILICENGETVYESRFINEWIEIKHPEPRLTPTDVPGILLTKHFEVLADGICDACVLLFWERARDPDKQSREWSDRQMRKAVGGLAELSRLLGDKEYCVNNTFGMADIAVGSLLGWLGIRFPDLSWRERHPNLMRLSDRLEARESFKSSVPYAQVIRDKVA